MTGRMTNICMGVVLAAASVVTIGVAQDGAGAPPAGAGVAAQATAPRSTAQKRAWLKQQLAKGVKERQQLQQFQTLVDGLTPQQINTLTKAVLAQQLPPNAAQQTLAQAQLELQRAILLRQMLERELAWRRYGAVGYRPIITWLPEGTSLGASAVVSPDGRYVRVSPSPLFSSVGPVYTYNLNTGETRLQQRYPYPRYRYGYSGESQSAWPSNLPQGYRGYSNTPGFGQMPRQHLPPQAPSAKPRRVYHDGLRTRVE